MTKLTKQIKIRFFFQSSKACPCFTMCRAWFRRDFKKRVRRHFIIFVKYSGRISRFIKNDHIYCFLVLTLKNVLREISNTFVFRLRPTHHRKRIPRRELLLEISITIFQTPSLKSTINGVVRRRYKSQSLLIYSASVQIALAHSGKPGWLKSSITSINGTARVI